MGCGASAGPPGAQQPASVLPSPARPSGDGCRIIPDQYSSFAEVSQALRSAGLEASQLVVGVDFTKSNTWTGANSFGGRCLHESRPDRRTPYEQVIACIYGTLEPFDDDNLIPAYGFGDKRTKNRQVFSFLDDDAPCRSLEEAVQRYQAVARSLLGPPLMLSGPTSFAPLVRQAMSLVKRTGEYHILLIIADGQVDSVNETVQAIVDASEYALSIVMVGVGDGPWDRMEEFDDGLPQRVFDNFQFVEFNSLSSKYPKEKRDFAFAAHALMEIPDQYQTVMRLGYLEDGYHDRLKVHCWHEPIGPPDTPMEPQCVEPFGEPGMGP